MNGPLLMALGAFCRDFANGFLIAEICYKYFPSDFGLHSFENVVGNERKASNWALLERSFKVWRARGSAVLVKDC